MGTFVQDNIRTRATSLQVLMEGRDGGGIRWRVGCFARAVLTMPLFGF